MTDDKVDAASMLDAVEKHQSDVRTYTARGGATDTMVLFLAQGLAGIIGHANSDGAVRLALRLLAAVMLGSFAVRYSVRRHNLGGASALPTWAAATAVLIVGTIAGATLHGDARDAARFAVLGLGFIALGAAYRNASLLLMGGVLAITAAIGAVPVAAWLVPLVLWVGVVGYFGRHDLLKRLKSA